MARVDRFRGMSGIDWKAWRQDIMGRMLNDHVGGANSINGPDLARLYFGKGYDLEDYYLVLQQVGIVMGILRERSVLLTHQGGGYFIIEAGDTIAAKGEIAKFGRRQVRLQERQEAKVEAAHKNYELPAGDPLALAIKAAGKGVRQIAAHVGLALPEGKKDSDEDTPCDNGPEGGQ